MTTTMAELLSKDKLHEQEPPLPLKPQGSKVFSKLFSRESSAAAPSFRVYYGVASAGSVPFLWESQPGTPKNDAVSAATLPPLTPPPSYYTAANKLASRHKSPAAAVSTATSGNGKTTKQCKHGSSRFLSAILPKIILHHRRSSRSSSSSSPTASTASSASSSAFSSSSSLSFRSAQSPASASMRSRVFAFSTGGDDDSEEEEQAPATCFRVRHESFRALKTCRVATTVRSALASVGGHGTPAQKV